MRPAPSLRLRFACGLGLGLALGVVSARLLAGRGLGQVAAQAEQRQAVIELQALSALVAHAADDDALRASVAAWQKATPAAVQVRVTRGMQLVASTAAAEKAPRRLQREEKPIFDRAQRLASAVQTNRDEPGSRKPEIELAPLGNGRLSLAAPVEGGLVELEALEGAARGALPWGGFLLALVAPLLVFAGVALLAGERRSVLAVAASLCLAGSLLSLAHSSGALLEADLRRATDGVASRAREQAALVQALGAAAVTPAQLDVDAQRKPRGELSPDGQPEPARVEAAVVSGRGSVRDAAAATLVLALALLLASGLGFFHRVGSALLKNRQAYYYIAPAMLGMLVLVFYPFSFGITLSFTDSNLYNTNQSIPEIWIGLRNYAEILGHMSFLKPGAAGFEIDYSSFYWTLIFTVIWTICNVAIGTTTGLILALILNTRGLALRPVYRMLLILPWAMPNYITALIWKGMFHQQFGVINQVLQLFGAPPVSWFDRPFTSFLTALATNGWLSFPFMMVVSLGALQSIPADLYEAARVDGASRWQQFRAITLPSLRPALVPAIILSVVWTFNMFNIIYLVTGGEPGGATEILVTQAYKYAFERYRYGYAAAYSTVIFGILLVYGTIQNRLSKATGV